MDTRTVHDPFQWKAVQISDNLTDRLRGRYACGPTLPNGEPEFGWKQYNAPPIQHEAADAIEGLQAALQAAVDTHEGRKMRVGALTAALVKIRDSRSIEGYHTRQAQALQDIAATALDAEKQRFLCEPEE